MGDSVTFQLFSLHNCVNYRGGDDSLLCFGRDASGVSTMVEVESFRPFFYVQMTSKEWHRWYPVLCFISLYKRLNEKYFDSMSTQDEMCEMLAVKLKRPPFHKAPECSEESGYGIREVKFASPDPFVKLEFRNWHGFTTLKYTMRDYAEIVASMLEPSSMLSNVNAGSVGTESERAAIVPLVEFIDEHSRYEFKTYEGCYDCQSMFLIHYGVHPSGWLTFENVRKRNNVRLEPMCVEYVGTYHRLVVCEGSGPALSPVKILSYDIEAVPHMLENGETLFPQPWRDPICTIGVACYQYGTCAREMHAFCLGETPDNWSSSDDPSGDDFDPSLVHVHSYEHESEMVLGFRDFIQSYDPDFITGYNIVNFDNYYTLMRLDALAACSDKSRAWGRGAFKCVPQKKFSQSKQTGGREYWDVKIVGREFLDIFAICKIDHKLRSYKLDEVAAHFLGTRKIEIRYDDIPRMCKTPEGRKRLAVYCVKDAYLPLQLCLKLSKLQNTISLSYVTGAPINHILNRGQQIRCLNIIVRCARKRTPRLYIPDRSIEHTEGFKGAVVIDPLKGYYEAPIIVMDFASLYPSIMIANNMCFSTKITRADARREKLTQGEDYLAIRDFKREGDTFEYIDKEDDVCFLLEKRRKGILPEILQTLLANRKIYKKKMKKAKEGTLDHGVANGMQLALKICANSVYGFSGASRGVLTDPEISSSVTKRGRGMTNEASWYAETKFTGTRTVYGDSVSGRTPLLLKHDGNIIVKRICDLKLDALVPTYTWTEHGWTKIENIVCHRLRPDKQMLRIFTHTGMVDCTSDHSLVHADGHAMFPSSIVCGETSLMQSFPKEWPSTPQVVDVTCIREFVYCGKTYSSGVECAKCVGLPRQPPSGVWKMKTKTCVVTADFARLMGFFMGDGSCGSWRARSTWQLNNANYTMLLYYQSILEKIFPEFEWTIMDTMASSSVYKLVPCKSQYGSVVHFTKAWRNLAYCEKNKIVPSVILNSPREMRSSFLRGLHDADGTKKTKLPEISQKSQIAAHSICTLMRSLGYTVVVDGRKDKPNVFRLRCRTRDVQTGTLPRPNIVKRVIELPHEEYVYDLTTENHHFHAGIGNIVVHNTDSIFVELDATVCPTVGKSEEEVIARAKEWGDVISRAITKDCFRAPNDLEYEKCFYPFLLKGKKRYAGLKFEPGKKTKMDIKGFECVRRDYAPFVSSTQLTVFQKLVGERNKEGAISFAKEVVRKLVEGELELSDLTMSKQLTRPPEEYKSNSIHVELAKRLKRELPETMQPKVGDRIDYVVRSGPEKLYQRGVQPHEVVDGPYSLDVDWYVNNQLREPYMRIFDMVMDNASSIFHIYDRDNEIRKEAKRKARDAMKAEQRRKKMKVKDIRSFFSS